MVDTSLEEGLAYVNVRLLPCPIDEFLQECDRRLFDPLLDHTKELRRPIPEVVRQGLNQYGRDRLCEYAGQKAEDAVRLESERELLKGALALLLLRADEDFRTVFIYLCLLDNSARRLGYPLFQRVEGLLADVPAELAGTFRQYIASGGRKLGEMRMAEEGEGASFRYRQLP